MVPLHWTSSYEHIEMKMSLKITKYYGKIDHMSHPVSRVFCCSVCVVAVWLSWGRYWSIGMNGLLVGSWFMNEWKYLENGYKLIEIFSCYRYLVLWTPMFRPILCFYLSFSLIYVFYFHSHSLSFCISLSLYLSFSLSLSPYLFPSLSISMSLSPLLCLNFPENVSILCRSFV